MNGYDLCKDILEDPRGGIEGLLAIAQGECEWLELKASIYLLPENEENDYKKSQKDLYWNIAKAIISLMNTCGGAVIIGIEDKSHDLVSLKSKDQIADITEAEFRDNYRKEIYNKIWSEANKGEKKWGVNNKYHAGLPLPEFGLVDFYPYKGGQVAVILVKPVQPCLKIWEKESEKVWVRDRGAVGGTRPLMSFDAIASYERERSLEAYRPASADSRFNIILDEVERKISKKRKRHLCTQIAGISFGLIFLVSMFLFWILPIIVAPEVDPPKDGGELHPDQITVEHPWITIEWYCLNRRVWWVVSDYIDTSYGRWELQRNKVLGNFRIVDPRNIMRCWGPQKQVLSVFNKLKEKLKKECSPVPLPKASVQNRKE